MNSSINFLIACSCLTTLLFLAFTLPAPDKCSMVTSAVACSFWITSMNSKRLGCAFRAIFFRRLCQPSMWLFVHVPSWLNQFHVLTSKCPSNHVDLKYWMNSSTSLVWSASDSTRVQAILTNLGGIKGSAADLWMKFLVSASFLYGSAIPRAWTFLHRHCEKWK